MKNIKDFVPTDLSGEKLPLSDDLRTIIGNGIYFASGDINVCKEAAKLYSGEDFNPSPEMVDAVNRSQGLAAWVKLQLTEWLNA